jgi:DNA segregation ATPase FtsK/SpoIIIE, S-DNA-T family
MATQTKIRAGGQSKGGKKRSPAAQINDTLPLSGRMRAVGNGLTGLLPDTLVSDRFRREIVGAILALLACLSSWSLGKGDQDGRLVQWLGDALHASFGRGAFLVPLFLILTTVRAFRTQEGEILLPRHYLGGAAFALAVTGLLQLSGSAVENDGGRLGLAVATLLKGAVGELGSGLILFAAGAIGVFLLAGTDLLTFWRDVRALMPERYYADEYDEFAFEPPSTRTAKDPQGMIELAAAIPSAPVINVPSVEPKTVEKPATGKKDVAIAPGDPMPLPNVGQLAHYEGVKLDTTDLEGKARRIEETLGSFKVDARVREINPGPAVTQFTLEPGAGIKVRRITELQNDLALALAAPSIRIEAPIPGMARVGVEIPNAQVATVGLRETLESSTFARGKSKLPIPLGRDVNGRYVVGDLTRMPHLLIAGATGSGKSVCLNGIISTFLLTCHPEELKLLMIDPKMVELTGYNGVPHLQCPVVTEMDKVVGALRLVLREMERRYTIFNKIGVRNIDGYRMKVADEVGTEKLPYLVVIIDELADLMMTAPEEVETLLVRLAQMARATGIHLIIATQRPSVDVLTGLIKANVPARIAFAVTSLTDSRVVLDLPGAERLLGRGDMLFLPPDAAKPQRIQGAFIEDKDVHYIVDHWHKVSPIPHYAQEWLELPSTNAVDDDGEEDPLMEQALEIVRNQGTASASMLQRRLRIGYNRAARLIERMEHEGIIGPADGIKGRPFLAFEE